MEKLQENLKIIQANTTYASFEKAFVLFVLVGFPPLLLYPILRLWNQYTARALISPTASSFDLLGRVLSASWGYLLVLVLMIVIWSRMGQLCGFEYARMHFRSVYLKLSRGLIEILLYLSAIGIAFSLKEIVIGSVTSVSISGDQITASLTSTAYTVLLVSSVLVGFLAKKQQDDQQELAYRPAEIYDWIAWMYKKTGIGKLFIDEGGEDPHDIRCTVFMRYKSSHSRLIQVCDYCPPSSYPTYRFGNKEDKKKVYGKANRTYRITNRNDKALGVLGHFVEGYLHEKNHTPDDWKKKKYTTYLTEAKAYDRASFIDSTMGRFHYSGFFARQFSDNRKSYYCLAITTQAEELLGVLYFDSCEERTFTTKNWEVVEGKIILHYLSFLGRILTQHEQGVNHDYG